ESTAADRHQFVVEGTENSIPRVRLYADTLALVAAEQRQHRPAVVGFGQKADMTTGVVRGAAAENGYIAFPRRLRHLMVPISPRRRRPAASAVETRLLDTVIDK